MYCFKMAIVLMTLLKSKICQTISESMSKEGTLQILTVTNLYKCKGRNNNVFESVQDTINYMVEKHKVKDSLINKDPYRIIINVKLEVKIINENNSCSMINKTDIYNPFILGTVNNQYSKKRAASNNKQDKCCLSLPNTYDLQLVIESSDKNKKVLIWSEPQIVSGMHTQFFYFPTIKIMRIHFSFPLDSKQRQQQNIVIEGYNFTGSSDSKPDLVAKRFGLSKFVFQDNYVYIESNKQFLVRSTFKEIIWIGNSINFQLYRNYQEPFVKLIVQSNQIKQIFDSQKKVNPSQPIEQIKIGFNQMNLFRINEDSWGSLLDIIMDNDHGSINYEFMKIIVVYKDWKMRNLGLNPSTNEYQAFLNSAIDSRFIETQINKFDIENCMFAIPFIKSPNIVKFDNIVFKKNQFRYANRFIQSDVIRSYNVVISNNSFYYYSNIFYIKPNQLISIDKAKQQNIRSVLNKIELSDNLVGYLTGYTKDDISAFIICEGFNSQNNYKLIDKGSIKLVRQNTGLEIKDLNFTNNQCVSDDSISVCQMLKSIKTKWLFDVKIVNIWFNNNLYISTNKLESTNYISITNLTIIGYNNTNSKAKDSKTKKTVSKKLSNYQQIQAYIKKNKNFNQYVLSIHDFHNVEIVNTCANNTSLMGSLFQIVDENQLQQTRLDKNKQSVLNINGLEMKQGIFIYLVQGFSGALIHTIIKNKVDFTICDVNIQGLKVDQRLNQKNDIATFLYFKGQKSQVMIKNVNIKDSAYSNRIGLVNFNTYKLSIVNCSFVNIANQNDDFIKFNDLKVQGGILLGDTRYLVMDRVKVDGLMAQYTGIVSMHISQPLSSIVCKILKTCSKDVVSITNSNFTNIVVQEKAILFDICFKFTNINNQLVFDNIRVNKAYSLVEGPLFRLHHIQTGKTIIKNSQFSNFKAGSGAQFFQYLDIEQMKHYYETNRNKLKISQLNLNNLLGQISKQLSSTSTLIVDNCKFDNNGMMNDYIFQLYKIDNSKSKSTEETIHKYVNKYTGMSNGDVMKSFQKLEKYTHQVGSFQFDKSDLNFYNRIKKLNEFTGGSLICLTKSKLEFKNSEVKNFHTLQGKPDVEFGIVLKAHQKSKVDVENSVFKGINCNKKGLFDIDDSVLNLKNCTVSDIFDISNSIVFDEQYKKQKGLFAKKSDDQVCLQIVDNKMCIMRNLAEFKGGIVANKSVLKIEQNLFRDMKCIKCTGLVLSAVSTSIKVKDNVFENNQGYEANCLHINGNKKQLMVNQSDLIQQNNQYSIKDVQVEILNNKFIKNKAQLDSAAIFIKDQMKVVIDNNTFDSNIAKSGVCIQVIQQVYNNLMVVSNNQFENNKAEGLAQILYKNQHIYDLASNSFKNNVAKIHSNSIFSYPSKMKLNVSGFVGTRKVVENEFTLDNYAPDLSAIPLDFIFYDEVDDEIQLDNYVTSKDEFAKIIHISRIETLPNQKQQGSIYPYKNATQVDEDRFVNPNVVKPNKTWTNNFQIRASPFSKVTIEFKSDIVKQWNNKTGKLANTGIFRLTINFRECNIGEYYDKQLNYCQICQNGTYSFDVEKRCQKYGNVQYMDNALGGSITSVKEGAWRLVNNTENILPCSNPNYCKPDKQKFPKAEYSSSNFLCSIGHIGPLCESCDHFGVFWGKSYQYSVQDKGCTSCDESSWSIIWFLAFMIGVGLFGIYTVNNEVTFSINDLIRKKLKNNRQLFILKSHRVLLANQRIAANKNYCESIDNQQGKMYPMKLKYRERDDGFSHDVYVENGDEKTKQELNILSVDYNEILHPATLMKILITYLLILSITIDHMKATNIEIDFMKRLFVNAGEPMKQASYSLECLIISLGLKDVPVYVIKDILAILSPLINWAMFLILWKIIMKTKITEGVALNSLSFIVFYNYPQIIQSTFPAIIRQNYNGISYVQSDTKYLYESEEQDKLRYFIYIPALVIFLVLIPAVFILFLKRNKKKLQDNDFKMKFGFIYQEYRDKCYYIEFMKIGLKVMIMITQSIYKGQFQLQVSIIQQILTVYLILMIKIKPYNQHSANTIELYNIILGLVNMIMVNSIYWSQKDSKLTTHIFMVILISLNLAFMFVFIHFAFRQQITRVAEAIVKLKHDLQVVCPMLKKYNIFRQLSFNYNTQESKLRWQRIMKLLKANQFNLEDIQNIAPQEIDPLDNSDNQIWKKISMVNIKENQNYLALPDNSQSQNDKSLFSAELSQIDLQTNKSLQTDKSLLSIQHSKCYERTIDKRYRIGAQVEQFKSKNNLVTNQDDEQCDLKADDQCDLKIDDDSVDNQPINLFTEDSSKLIDSNNDRITNDLSYLSKQVNKNDQSERRKYNRKLTQNLVKKQKTKDKENTKDKD